MLNRLSPNLHCFFCSNNDNNLVILKILLGTLPTYTENKGTSTFNSPSFPRQLFQFRDRSVLVPAPLPWEIFR